MAAFHLSRALPILVGAAFSLVTPQQLLAQCCLGAQDSEHLADNGRYRVRAVSQTGTGPTAHGPYRFEFTLEARDRDEAWRTIASFERQWETNAHFSMSVCASPTGNGFLLSTSMDDRVVLLGKHGRVLQDALFDAHEVEASLWVYADCAPDVRFAQEGKESLRAQIFVPFAELHHERAWSKEDRDYTVAPSRQRFVLDDITRRHRLAMLTWSEKQGAVDAPRAEAAIAQVRSDDLAAIAAGRDALIALGMSARAPLADAIARAATEQDAAFRARLAAIATRMEQLACGHDTPHRNLDLLAATLAHPDAEMRLAAAGQLRRLLPKGATITAEWLQKHGSDLTWDDAAGAFLKTR